MNRPDKAVVGFLLPMTPRARVVLSLLTGLIIGVITTYSVDFGYFSIPQGRSLGFDIGYVGTASFIVWLTLAVWFFIFLKWAQGKDLSNRLKLLEIRKLEMQIAIVEQAHPDLKELPV